MSEHAWRDQFHQRGHHVQSAHGRRTELAAQPADDHTQGCMIALMPTVADAKRLALPGGEAADQLHCTLSYLGPDAGVWSPDDRVELIALVRRCFEDAPPVQSKIFGAAHWNGGGEKPSWVWSVGDDPEADTVDCGLDNAHHAAVEALESRHGGPDDMPVNFTPWVAHICAAYSPDLSLIGALEQRLGPVTFDRVRVSFGDEDTDIPLNGSSVTAAGKPDPAHGVFRRRPTAAELASCVDFAGHQRDWTAAVDGALHDWAAVTADWRNQIYAHLAADGSVDAISVDTTAAVAQLLERMTAAAEAAGRAQERAARAQGIDVPAWSLSEDDALTASMSGLAFLRKVAQLTASVLGTSLATSAKRQAMRLLATYSGIRLASEIEQFLQTLTDKVARNQLGSAMSAAQQTGRNAVLQVAPTGEYTASEILDNRTCPPCKAIDGTVFPSLEAAEAAYPGGAYEQCQGGGNCRGTYIATWAGSVAASAAEEPVAELGAKPVKGTPKDKRLKENQMTGNAPCADCPGDAEHFASDAAVAPQTEHFAWDGAASRFTDPQYEKAAAACDAGDGTVKERCFLPHHDPDGALNRDGLAAAAGRLSGLKGHSPAAVAAARSHLRAHYKQIGEDAPPNLEAAAHTHALAQSCPDGWKPDPDGDGCVPMIWEKGDAPPKCPPGMMRDPDADGCVPVTSAAARNAAAEALAAAVTPDAPEQKIEPSDGPVAPWFSVIVVEGKPTGDGREFAAGSLDWRDLPLPLRWNKEDSHGGEPRTVAVNVGRIDSIERVGDELHATGVIDLSTEDGQTVRDKVKGKFIRGISIDADNIKDADIELVWPEGDGEGTDEDNIFAQLFAAPDKVVYHGGRISGATLCDIPAFAEAYLALTDDQGTVLASGQLDAEEWEAVRPDPEPAPRREAVTASIAGWEPPAEWFKDPQLSLPTPITIDESGRVYGHAAPWGVCHIGQTGQCIQAPREAYHDHYMIGAVRCADGSTVSVGQITVGTGHAPLHVGAAAATEHYDNTGTAVADVCVGNDSHGIWVAGAIRAGADPEKVAALRASGRISGDWRRIGGKLRLVGLLAVNVPGFPVPKMRARVASGAPQALVAAGHSTVAPGYSQEQLEQMAMRTVMEMLARRTNKE